MGISSYQI